MKYIASIQSNLNDNPKLSDYIRLQLKKIGKTNKWLAGKSDTTLSGIEKILNRGSIPYPLRLKRIFKAIKSPYESIEDFNNKNNDQSDINRFIIEGKKRLSSLIVYELNLLEKSQYWLANEAACKQSSINDYIHKKCLPKSPRLKKIFKALDVIHKYKTLDDLVKDPDFPCPLVQ